MAWHGIVRTDDSTQKLRIDDSTPNNPVPSTSKSTHLNNNIQDIYFCTFSSEP
jgi:hypothetical protein